MPSLNLGCPCGATLAYTGSDIYLKSHREAWLKAHANHETKVPDMVAQLEDLARSCSLSLEEITAAAKTIAEQWSSYAGIQGHEITCSVEAYLEGQRARAEVWRVPPRLGDLADGVTPADGLAVEINDYITQLRMPDRGGAYRLAREVADDLAKILAGTRAADIVQTFHNPGKEV